MKTTLSNVQDGAYFKAKRLTGKTDNYKKVRFIHWDEELQHTHIVEFLDEADCILCICMNSVEVVLFALNEEVEVEAASDVKSVHYRGIYNAGGLNMNIRTGKGFE